MTVVERETLAIDLSHVSKTYRGKVQALRGIEMRVHRGEVFGLLGPNGAGKSTLVKVLMTVIKPTKCQGTMLGRPVGDKSMLRLVGYLPEHHRFSDYLTGAQVLDFYGALCNVPRRERKRRGRELLDLVGMTAWADKRVRSYSKGMRQRIGVAQALINDPDLVLLDEPTDGVDPVGRRDIRAVCMKLKEQGKTVFINSHLLSELELVCDRVAILVQGLVSAQGTIDELTKDQQRYEIEIVPPAINGDEGVQLLAQAIPALRPDGAKRLKSGEAMTVHGSTLHIQTTDPDRVQALIDAIRAGGGIIRSVRQFRPTLEDLFMRAVTDPNTGEILAPGAASNGAGGGGGDGGAPVIRQTIAIFVDAYRELNAKKMFWIVLVLSLLCVAALASVGLYDDGQGKKGISLLFWKLPPIGFLDVLAISKKTFYNLMFFSLGFKIWLTWAATILALISTAGIIPDFITGGSVEMVLSKPIGRFRLFVTKYLAGLLFVVLQVSVFAVAAWLVIGVRSGSWQPALFLAIPVVTALFSYLFAFQVLIGMLTRSVVASLLITICLWLCIFLLHIAEAGIILEIKIRKNQEVAIRQTDLDRYKVTVEAKRTEAAAATAEDRERFDQTVKTMESVQANKESSLAGASEDAATLNNVHSILFACKTVLPKTSETIDLLQRWLVSAADIEGLVDNAPEPPRERRRFGGDIQVSERSVQKEHQSTLRARSIGWVLGTSLTFEAIVVLIAAWLFRRRDF